MLSNLKIFLRYFGFGFNKYIVSFLLGGIVIAIFETCGILLIFPLMEMVSSPTTAVKSGVMRIIFQSLTDLGYPSYALCLGVFSICVGGIYVFKALFQMLFVGWEYKTLSRWKISISHRFFKKFLNADYGYHVHKNSSEITSIISSSISYVVDNGMHQYVSLFTQLIVGVFLCTFLLISHPLMTLVIAICFYGLFQGQKRFIKQRISQASQHIDIHRRENYFALQQGLAAYKETKINLKEKFFSDLFLRANRNLTDSEGRLLFLQSLPVSLTELIVMLMTIIAFNMIVAAGSSAESITQNLAALVMTLFRLIPVVNRSLNSVSFINSAVEPLRRLIKEADAIGFSMASDEDDRNLGDVSPLNITSELTLSDLTYTYPKALEPAISDVNLSVRKGEFVGIIGSSGAGKTTLVAILLGFIQADEGQYSIDGKPVDQNLICSLRKSIGYVDQQPFIFDTSVMQNVAFGMEIDEIDRDRVEAALRQAELWEYVSAQDMGMEASVGENGKRLSGGQRQRLAIARALYKQPSLLILDEATSALDVETEHRISATIQNLKGSLTIIAIAHRLSTLRSCDRLIMMEKGRIVDAGSHEELQNRNATFRRLLAISEAREPGATSEAEHL